MTDDLREKVARELWFHGEGYGTFESKSFGYFELADAVLAVVDPDGLRAEVERLRAALLRAEDIATVWRETSARERRATTEMGERYDDAVTKIVDARAERDAAVREAAALRAGVEALANEWEKGAPHRIVGAAVASDLRALLAAPTPEES
jgi:hypothetical protein